MLEKRYNMRLIGEVPEWSNGLAWKVSVRGLSCQSPYRGFEPRRQPSSRDRTPKATGEPEGPATEGCAVIPPSRDPQGSPVRDAPHRGRTIRKSFTERCRSGRTGSPGK